jgi:hypothetical protein
VATTTRRFSFQYIPEYRASHGHGATCRILDQEICDPDKPQCMVRYRRDAVCCIGTPNGKALFEIEYDRGSEVLQGQAWRRATIARKVAIFLASLKHRHFERYSGENFFNHPFRTSRLLIVTNSDTRMNNITNLCLTLNTHGMVYLTTMNLITTSDALGPIWLRPVNGGLGVQSLVGGT